MQQASSRGALLEFTAATAPPLPRLPKHGSLIISPMTGVCPFRSDAVWPRKDSKEAQHSFYPQTISPSGPLSTSSTFCPSSSHDSCHFMSLPKSPKTLCGDSPGVRHFEGEWEKLHFHSSVPPLTAKMNIYFHFPGPPVSYCGEKCFSLLSEGKLWWVISMSGSLSGFPSGLCTVQFSHVQLFATPWTAARQASLSITNSRSLLKPMSIELVISSNHLILCLPLLLPPSIFPCIRVFSNESVLRIKWPKLCTKGPYSMSICSRETPWGPRHSIPASPKPPPHQATGLKYCQDMLPVGEGRPASGSLKPALNLGRGACHQSPSPSLPQLNEQIRKEN